MSKSLPGKFTRREDGTWRSSCGRWRIVRASTGRYDLHDLNKAEGDELVLVGVPTVAACEESARGIEWTERQEEDPSGKKPEE